MVLTPFIANRFIEKHRQRYFIPSSLHHFIPNLRETPPKTHPPSLCNPHCFQQIAMRYLLFISTLQGYEQLQILFRVYNLDVEQRGFPKKKNEIRMNVKHT